MTLSRKTLITLPILAFALTVAYLTYAAEKTHTLTFVMAHKPDNAENVALIQTFANRVFERTNGAVRINPVMPNYAPEAGDRGADVPIRALQDVASGNAFLAQISVKRFSELYPELYPLNALDAPGVFRSHEHAARVLDGDVGLDLMRLVNDKTGGMLRALGFTYSGGYRNIFSTVPVSSLSDLEGQPMRAVSHMSEGVMAGLGIHTIDGLAQFSEEWPQAIADGTVVLEEAENLRIESYRHSYPDVIANMDTVVETNHSMYLTLLVANGPAMDALTQEQRDIIAEEAHALALAERELSVRQADEIKARFQNEGVTFLALTDTEKQRLEAIAEDVRAQYASRLGTWFDRIEAVQ